MEKFNQIKEILVDTFHNHLAECLDMVPEANLVAIDKMIQAHKDSGTQKTVYRYQVVQDVAALLEGHISSPLFSQLFLEQTAQPAGECGMCHCTDNPVSLVSIPYSDIEYMCADCMGKLPLQQGVVDYRVNKAS